MTYAGSRVGLGIVTYDRPQRLKNLLATIGPIVDCVDEWIVFEDGSPTSAARHGYDELETVFLEGPFIRGAKNQGVGYAKNRCFESLLRRGCDWIVIVEDDMMVLSENAVLGYVDACETASLDHLSFAKHGACNASYGIIERRSDGIELWPCSVGAWCIYSRRCLEDVGLMDEHFVNCLEHVEHTYRLARAGYTTPFWRFADAAGSEFWVQEQADTMETSTFKGGDFAEGVRRTAEAKVYWNQKHGEEFWT